MERAEQEVLMKVAEQEEELNVRKNMIFESK